jgi:ATP phosphoribosyltransferase regulatory subunit
LPLRLSYNASIFRQQEFVAGRDAEFTQAGVELIGDASPDADAELIALAVTTLRALGLRDFRLALGQVGFVNGVLAEHVKDGDLADRMRFTLAEKNHVGFEDLVTQVEDAKARRILLQIPQLRGGLEVLQQARGLADNRIARQALDNLEEIWRILVLYGVDSWVQIDLGLVLGLNYYTGAVFEGYAPQIGFPLCGGGRYDDLLEKFGRPLPATGFMIGIERVWEVLARTGERTEEKRYLIGYYPGDRQHALAFAAYLRGKGCKVATQRIYDGWQEGFRGKSVIVSRLENGRLETEEEAVRRWYEAYQEQE